MHIYDLSRILTNNTAQDPIALPTYNRVQQCVFLRQGTSSMRGRERRVDRIDLSKLHSEDQKKRKIKPVWNRKHLWAGTELVASKIARAFVWELSYVIEGVLESRDGETRNCWLCPPYRLKECGAAMVGRKKGPLAVRKGRRPERREEEEEIGMKWAGGPGLQRAAARCIGTSVVYFLFFSHLFFSFSLSRAWTYPHTRIFINIYYHHHHLSQFRAPVLNHQLSWQTDYHTASFVMELLFLLYLEHESTFSILVLVYIE